MTDLRGGATCSEGVAFAEGAGVGGGNKVLVDISFSTSIFSILTFVIKLSDFGYC